MIFLSEIGWSARIFSMWDATLYILYQQRAHLYKYCANHILGYMLGIAILPDFIRICSCVSTYYTYEYMWASCDWKRWTIHPLRAGIVYLLKDNILDILLCNIEIALCVSYIIWDSSIYISIYTPRCIVEVHNRKFVSGSEIMHCSTLKSIFAYMCARVWRSPPTAQKRLHSKSSNKSTATNQLWRV